MRKQLFLSSIVAGCLVGIGGIACLSSTDPIVGALLFTFGLFAICTFGFHLYTGKIGYILDTPALSAVLDNVTVWLGNLAGAVMLGLLTRWTKPELLAKAQNMCSAKLTQGIGRATLMAILCGVMIYVAVDVYKKQNGFNRYLGILIGIPLFILCGFEHSVADMFYLALYVDSPASVARAACFILLVTLGNAAGSILFFICQRVKNGKPILPKKEPT